MGTNYYTKIKECECCGRFEEIHLGKSSCGWKFSFQYNDGKYYKNFDEMKSWLKDKVIKDEYNRIITLEEFFLMIKDKQKETNSHADKYKSERDFVIDGYSFTNCEFC